MNIVFIDTFQNIEPDTGQYCCCGEGCAVEYSAKMGSPDVGQGNKYDDRSCYPTPDEVKTKIMKLMAKHYNILRVDRTIT